MVIPAGTKKKKNEEDCEEEEEQYMDDGEITIFLDLKSASHILKFLAWRAAQYDEISKIVQFTLQQCFEMMTYGSIQPDHVHFN